MIYDKNSDPEKKIKQAPEFQTRWGDLSWTEFESCDPKTVKMALLPVGAIEQHGPHLPLSVDSDIIQALTTSLSAALTDSTCILPPNLIPTNSMAPLLLLPLQPIGFSQEHTAYPGTLTFNPQILYQSWVEIGEAVHRTGIKRLLILNGHGGNPPVMEMVARDLRSRLGMLVGQVNSYDLVPVNDYVPLQEVRFGIHGGLIETALMLHLYPEKVRLGCIKAFPSTAAAWDESIDFSTKTFDGQKRKRAIGLHGPHRIGWQAQDLNLSGAIGDASLADATIGATLFKAMLSELISVLADFLDHPLPEQSPYPKK